MYPTIIIPIIEKGMANNAAKCGLYETSPMKFKISFSEPINK